MTGKHISEMTPQEAAAELARLRRGPPPEPMPVDRKAKDLTKTEREEWLREHVRRFG